MCIHKSWNGVGDGICGLSGDYNIRLCLGDEPNNTAVLFFVVVTERVLVQSNTTIFTVSIQQHIQSGNGSCHGSTQSKFTDDTV